MGESDTAMNTVQDAVSTVQDAASTVQDLVHDVPRTDPEINTEHPYPEPYASMLAARPVNRGPQRTRLLVLDGCYVLFKMPGVSGLKKLSINGCQFCVVRSGCRFDEGERGMRARYDLYEWAREYLNPKNLLRRGKLKGGSGVTVNMDERGNRRRWLADLAMGGMPVEVVAEVAGTSPRTVYYAMQQARAEGYWVSRPQAPSPDKPATPASMSAPAARPAARPAPDAPTTVYRLTNAAGKRLLAGPATEIES